MSDLRIYGIARTRAFQKALALKNAADAAAPADVTRRIARTDRL